MSKPTYNEKTKVWSGQKISPLYNPDQNLGQLICRVLEQTPDAVTQISADTNISVTCGEMRDRALKFARHLSESGYEQGDVIGFIADNSENLAPAVFACFVLGIAVNPLSPIMLESDIVQMYSKTKPKLIICDAKNVKTVQNAVNLMKSDAKIYTVMEKVIDYDCVTEIINQMNSVDNFNYPPIDSNSTAAILCSSGSTGFPKGICKSHRELIVHNHPSSNFNRDGNNVLFNYSPIFWFTGFYYLIMGTLYKFLRIITMKSFSPNEMADYIERYKITHVFLPPFAIQSLLQVEDLMPFETIKHWLVGGSVVSKTLCDDFEQLIPNGEICIVFGTTEQNIITTNMSKEKYGSSGAPIQNVDVKIIDDDGNALNNFEQGEILTKNPVQFSSYFDEPEKTRETCDGEFFKTGDIGYFDNDGYLYVVDRKKDMMKYQGYQITSSELESIINEIKGVVSSCVVGVVDYVNSNDIIHAYVIVNESSDLTENFILNYVNERVIDQKKIRGGVHIVKTFPLTLSGKVNKKEVKKWAESFSEIKLN